MTKIRFTGLVAVLMTLTMTVGCGSDLNTVTGTVTLDGDPLPDAVVMFTPLTGGRPVAGRTDSSGEYELVHSRSGMGTIVGEHVVEISTREEIAQEDDTVKMVPEKVPARYNGLSELRADVKPGANVFDFKLESGGDIIQDDAGESVIEIE